ncbi:hypothetical protein B0H16DRAFT_1727069 [Mycena metata]|uniref:Uncharacterized protein n=1 Tax=Mycena metata TaxID=1033252 RepID=A0AAD7N477_9AGAR|nr:hypothetical protein B0H16DRAFT_1727069 [Mycena metata]
MNFLNTTASFLADIAQPAPRRLLPHLFTNTYLPSAPRPLFFTNAYVPEDGAPAAPPAPTAPLAPPAHPASAAPLAPAEHPTPAAPRAPAEHPASAAPLISADHPVAAAPLAPTAPPTPAAPLASAQHPVPAGISSRHEYGRAASSALDDDLMSSRHVRGRADSVSSMSSYLSHGTQMSNIQSDPPTQAPPLHWDINGTEALRPLSPKANTKKDVISFLRDMYQISSKREAEEKYDQFRICVGLAADVHFTDHPYTSQSQEAIDLVAVTYPWFARTDGWPARPYLLDRQRNKAKRQGRKQSKAALELTSKHLHAISKVSKARTPLGLRKTRSMATALN